MERYSDAFFSSTKGTGKDSYTFGLVLFLTGWLALMYFIRFILSCTLYFLNLIFSMSLFSRWPVLYSYILRSGIALAKLSLRFKVFTSSSLFLI